MSRILPYQIKPWIVIEIIIVMIKRQHNKVKYRTKAKFEAIVLVWIAGFLKGLLRPFIFERGLAMNQNIYETECLKKRLIPFFQKHNSDKN